MAGLQLRETSPGEAPGLGFRAHFHLGLENTVHFTLGAASTEFPGDFKTLEFNRPV